MILMLLLCIVPICVLHDLSRKSLDAYIIRNQDIKIKENAVTNHVNHGAYVGVV